MTPAFWLLRALNLAAALAAARFASFGRPVALAAPAAAFAAAIAAEAAAVFSGGPSDPRVRRRLGLAFTALEAGLVVWLSFRAPGAAGVFDLAYLVPAVLCALEFGPAAGALAGLLPAGITAASLWQGLGPNGESFLPVALVRASFFVLVPVAAGLALPEERARAADRARGTLARLRAAQVGEYISFVLFQLRDYLITITSVSEAIALSVPKEDPKVVERLDKLRRSVAELNGKMSRLLGDKSALTSVAPPSQTAVDVPALARRVAEDARAAFGGTTPVDVLVEGSVPPAKTDRRPVELALLAVLQNSLEACALRGAGAVTVLVRARDGAAEIEVTDDGGGIAESVKPLVFEPLSSARAGGTGMGLGLSMSRRFLERLGGTLRLKSKGGATAALLVVPLDQQLPQIRNEESTWAGRRAGA